MRRTPLERPLEKPSHYKFWVEPSGNNHQMVKSVLKRRPWLAHCDFAFDYWDDEPIPGGVQLVWTQVGRGKIFR